jgi:hypothetical protein
MGAIPKLKPETVHRIVWGNYPWYLLAGNTALYTLTKPTDETIYPGEILKIIRPIQFICEIVISCVLDVYLFYGLVKFYFYRYD